MSLDSPYQKPLLVYLGPPGTYSHQAAFERFGDSVDYEPRETITNVYSYLPPTSLSSSTSPRQILHLLPLENSKNGIVLETLDLLLRPASPTPREERFIVREELRTKVQHCLVVSTSGKSSRKDNLEGIEWVRSHEQALAQCQTFLSTYLPSAKRIPVASTAHAAVSLLSPSLDSAFPAIHNDTADPEGRGAAICSRVVVDIYDGLECAREGIEDKKGNTTRFLILSRFPLPPSLSRRSNSSPTTAPSLHLTMLSFPSLPPTALSTILSPDLISLDRRPAQTTEDQSDGGGFRSGWLAVYQYEGDGEGQEECWWQDDEEEVGRLEGRWLGRWRVYGS